MISTFYHRDSERNPVSPIEELIKKDNPPTMDSLPIQIVSNSLRSSRNRRAGNGKRETAQ
jgi:hypothetical protein